MSFTKVQGSLWQGQFFQIELVKTGRITMSEALRCDGVEFHKTLDAKNNDVCSPGNRP